VVAAGSFLAESSPFDSVAAAQRHLTGSRRVEVSYDSTAGRVGWSVGPPMLDAGTFYSVIVISDSSLAGRWTDGSYLVTEVQRGEVTTLEHMQGFFCARRRDPAPRG
jgi:hypothetical protein